MKVTPVDPMSASAVFMAPELLTKEDELCWDEKVDVFSFGIILWCLFPENHSKRIYPFTNTHQIIRAVMDGVRPDEPQLMNEDGDIKHFYVLLKQLMSQCYQENPKRRPTAVEIFSTLSLLEKI